MTALAASIARLKSWFTDDALPLWVSRSYDDARGGFYETLDFDGKPIIGQPRRMRVQARQIHTFTRAGLRGWHKDAEALAAKGFDYFLAHACPDHGARGCVHLLDDDGAILDDRRDLYDQAFLLLACASRWMAAKDGRAIDLAECTIAFMDAELASPHGGWLEDDRGTLPRRQNPHMHLFEAFMALWEATGRQHYLDYTQKIFELFHRSFYDSATGVIREFFSADMTALEHSTAIEPGHMFEWVWLLRKYESASGGDFSSIRKTLFERAQTLGEDSGFYGFVGNEVATKGGDPRGDKRLWPQTEYLKACITKAANGKTHARAAILINDLFNSYLKTSTPGLWIDEFDAHGAPMAKDVPASILYHLFEAVAETADHANTMEAP